MYRLFHFTNIETTILSLYNIIHHYLQIMVVCQTWLAFNTTEEKHNPNILTKDSA